MAKVDERRQRPARSSWLTKVADTAGVTWELIKKGCLFGIGVFIVGLVVYDVVRECRFDGIVLENVVVKGQAADSGLGTEMASQQIATYIDRIQRTGAREWRPHDLDEGKPQQTVSIQIPGSSFNVESLVREIASLFPHRRKALRISITANPNRTGYVAAIAISANGSTMRATCEADNKPGSLGAMFECLAVEAMKTVDPLFAASYMLSVEQAQCSRFRPEQVAAINPVADKQRLLEVLRDYCGFERTRTMVSAIIDRGNPDDQPWVSYIFGKLHLARADAIAKVDAEAQWYEFDRAISRFREFPQDKVPASALAIQMDAYIKNGLSIHESVRSLKWKESASVIRYRLKAAEAILADAGGRLKELADKRQKAVTAGSAQARSADGSRVDSLVAHLRGLIVYRQWMIDVHRRHWKKPIDLAEGDKEKQQVSAAVSFFETSFREGRQTAWLFLDWGNALRALGKFDAAIEQYRRAGDIAPDYYAPSLNIAITLLEKSKIEAATATVVDHFEAVRHASNYLTWIGGGGPYGNLVDKIADVLAVAGDGSEARNFAECRKKHEAYEADARVTDLSHTAALKLCVDQARDSLARRVVERK
jgi:tetratricopeptide (TPR) repeat protein